MFEHDVLDICIVALECGIIGGAHIGVAMSTLTTIGTAAALPIHLGFVAHGDVLILSSPFRNNVETDYCLQ